MRAGGRSEALLSSPLFQAAAHPHGHHLGIAVVELYDEGVILERGKRGCEETWLQMRRRMIHFAPGDETQLAH